MLRAPLHRLALAAVFALASRTAAADVTAGAPPKAYASFAELRNDLLNAIGGATKRLWLATDYLTDGEIVSQLYVAQYRKLDVQVLLGRGKANFYMSRLNYLKAQNIPVFLRPDSFKVGHVSALLCDDRLYYVDGELDFMAKYRHFTLESVGPDEADRFAAAFAGAANLRVPALPRPIPLVGRAGGGGGGSGRGRAYQPSSQLPRQNTRTYSQGGEGDSFIYDRHQTPRPDGVPAKLPKALKWKQGGRGAAPLAAPAHDAAPAPQLAPTGTAPEAGSVPPALPEDDTKDGG